MGGGTASCAGCLGAPQLAFRCGASPAGVSARRAPNRRFHARCPWRRLRSGYTQPVFRRRCEPSRRLGNSTPPVYVSVAVPQPRLSKSTPRQESRRSRASCRRFGAWRLGVSQTSASALGVSAHLGWLLDTPPAGVLAISVSARSGHRLGEIHLSAQGVGMLPRRVASQRTLRWRMVSCRASRAFAACILRGHLARSRPPSRARCLARFWLASCTPPASISSVVYLHNPAASCARLLTCPWPASCVRFLAHPGQRLPRGISRAAFNM